jgi:DNA-binding response OmpR family regulator
VSRRSVIAVPRGFGARGRYDIFPHRLPSTPAREAITTETGKGQRVLFVEDEAGLRQAYQRYFQGRYELAFAPTGAEARARVRDFAPELVVLDLRLPDTDGIDLLRELRALRPSLRVVVTTSYASMQPLFEVLGIPYSGYLVKPFSLSDLEAEIDAAL